MYQGYIIKVEKIRPHSNADKLNIVEIFNQNVIVAKDIMEGDIVAYFPSDGRLNRDLAEYCNLLRKKDEFGNNVGGYMDADKCNIKAIKLRGEYSDGIIIPIDKITSFLNVSLNDIYDGNTTPFDTLSGVTLCEKYVPKKNKRNNSEPKVKKPSYNKFPLFHEHIDTKQLAYNLREFKHGDKVTLSLKMHGTSGRTSYSKSYEPNWFKRLWNVLTNKPMYEYVTGTRRVVLNNNDNGGYYGDNAFRMKWHEFFKDRLHKGETVYYEIVGFVSENKPIMPSGNNKKLNDKEFIKKYGEQTHFTYGCENGQNQIYVYRMTMTNEDGFEVEYSTEQAILRCEQMGVNHIPVLLNDIVNLDNNSIDDYFLKWNELTKGSDPVGKSHIREGIVVRIENRLPFVAFKQKSIEFKILEGIIKEDANVADMEELESE